MVLTRVRWQVCLCGDKQCEIATLEVFGWKRVNCETEVWIDRTVVIMKTSQCGDDEIVVKVSNLEYVGLTTWMVKEATMI
jgi:hypothetical protein